MRWIGNVIWILTGGWLTALMWLAFGLLCLVTVIGIPFGIQCFKFARLSFAPFGKKVEIHPLSHPIVNTIWAVFLGWEMACAYFASGVACLLTVVGIPAGIVSFKMMKLAFLPFGARVRSKKK